MQVQKLGTELFIWKARNLRKMPLLLVKDVVALLRKHHNFHITSVAIAQAASGVNVSLSFVLVTAEHATMLICDSHFSRQVIDTAVM